jgi:hypothetical protein
MIDKAVTDFPEPDSPTTPTVSPFDNEKESEDKTGCQFSSCFSDREKLVTSKSFMAQNKNNLF